MIAPAPAGLGATLAALFGEVWSDAAMTHLRAIEGAAPTWQGLHQAGAATTLATTTAYADLSPWLGDLPHKRGRLSDGAVLDVVRLGDGRLALHVTRMPPAPTVASLEAHGVWPAGVLVELAAALRNGVSVVLVDGRASARQASLGALIRELSADAAVVAVGDELPVSMSLQGPPASVWTHVSALQVDVLAVAESSADDAAAWLRQRRQAALLMSVDGDHAVWSAAMRSHGLDDHAAIVVVFQRAWPTRVIEMRTPPGYEPPAVDASVAVPPPPSKPSASVSPPARPSAAASSNLVPLSLLPEAAMDTDIDPGWELGAAPATPFERALASAATKPHVPHAPAAHPQMMALMRGTGGMTFGPPGVVDHGDDDSGDNLADIDIAPQLPDDT
jgi:hypothetical protein